MAFTLVEGAKLTRNMLVRGVTEQLITESAVLRHLPFVTVKGSGIDYNREATLPASAFYDVGDPWTEATPTHSKITAVLKILGGDSDLDSFIRQTYGNEQDIAALLLAERAKSVANTFNDTFFNGDTAVNAKAFDGLKKACGAVDIAMAYSATVRAATSGANGITPTLDLMDQFIDAVKPGKPDVLFMSKRTRRKLNSLKRAAGSGVLETTADAFGRRVVMYDGIPIEVDENILDTETQGASTDCSSIYAVKWGFKDGVCGLQNGGIQVERLGALETKDAQRWRVKWYCGLAVFRTWSVARFAGVRP